MPNLTTLLGRKIIPGKPIGLPPPGIYHFVRQEQGEKSRIHLRIEADHHAILLINANRIVHLNPTAAFMAHLALNQTSHDEAIRAISRAYQVSRSQATSDYAQFATQLAELIRPDGACPIHDLDLEVLPPFSAQPSAPYRMDLAITYRCNNDCAHCYNARPRSYPEISTAHWQTIIDKTWEIGVPHVVFTGGEPTLRPDLPELISHAERNGQITGINTNGRRLSDPSYLSKLVQAGLDHVQITLESHDAAIHDQMVNSQGAWQQTVTGIHHALDSKLYVMTNTTMLRQNSPQLESTLDFLAELGVPTIGLNALIYAGGGATVNTGIPEAELWPLLNTARQRTTAHQQRLIWYTPTEYCHFDPMELELGVKGCTAARYNMCIEPNGDVLPCQSYYQSVGNIINDPWQSIWNHSLCLELRDHQGLPEKCQACVLLSECGGGCPLHRQVCP